MGVYDVGILLGSIVLIFLLLPEFRKELWKKLPKAFTHKYGLIKPVNVLDPYTSSPPDPASPSNFGNPHSRTGFGMPAAANLTSTSGSTAARNRRAPHSTHSTQQALPAHSSHSSTHSTNISPITPIGNGSSEPPVTEVRATNSSAQSPLSSTAEEKKGPMVRALTESRLKPLHTDDIDSHLDEADDHLGRLTPSSSFGSAGMSPCSSTISDEFYRTLLAGRDFLKFGRHGNPHTRTIRLRLHKNRFVIDWSTGYMDLDSVSEIRSGKATAVFKRKSHSSYDEQKCFSIIAPKRTLDLQAKNKMERDLWVAALREISNTQTIQRTAAEIEQDDETADEPSVSANTSSLSVSMSMSNISLPSADGTNTPPRDIPGDKSGALSDVQELQTFMSKFPAHQRRLALAALQQKSPHLSFQLPSPLTANALNTNTLNSTQHHSTTDANEKRIAKLRDGPTISSTSASSTRIRQQTFNSNAAAATPSPTNNSASGKSTKTAPPLQRGGSAVSVTTPSAASLSHVKAFANAVHNEQKSDPDSRQRRKQSIPASLAAHAAATQQSHSIGIGHPVQPPGGLNFYAIATPTTTAPNTKTASTRNVHSVNE